MAQSLTITDIFDGLGGTSAVAAQISVGQSTASEMKRRGSIPVKYWDRLIGKHCDKIERPITLEDLHEAHREKDATEGTAPSLQPDAPEPTPEPAA